MVAIPRHLADLAGTRRNQFRINPAAATSSPTSGTHQIGEIHMDSAGAVWRCTVSGTPGTWVLLIDVVGGRQVALPVSSTVLDSMDITYYRTAGWSLELLKGDRIQVFQIVASHNGTTASEVRPVSMQIGTGTFDITAAVDILGDLLRLIVTPSTSGWTATWRQLYRLPRLPYHYLRPDSVSYYLRPDGTSSYLRP